MRLGKRLKYLSICALALQSFSISQPLTALANEDEDWNYVAQVEECDTDDSSGNSRASTPAGVDGDWLTEGSEKYKMAERLFKYLTEELGLSGAFASAMLANAKGESNFVPDRGESAFDKPYAERRFGMNNKTPTEGMGPSTATQNASYGYSYFGGGLFQITPWQKFAESEYWGKVVKDEGWAPENQMQFIWDSEFANKAVHTYYDFHSSAGVISGAADAVNRLGKFGSVEEAISTDDPAKAVVYFQIGYERPQDYHREREEWAKQANAVFNKNNIKADKSKWKFSNTSIAGVDSATKNAKKKEDVCEEKTSKAGWGDDGTGTHNYGSGWDVWRPENLPDDLKKYAIDPTSLGMKFSSSEGWPNAGDQCAHFSESMFSLIWTKDGSTPSAVTRTNYGKEEAYSHANAYGGKVSKKPVKGAVSGTPATATNSAGHTYIVSHVFANGDILVVEQNITGFSGGNNGENCTWNYRIVLKSQYESENHEFYSAETEGYKPNSKIKMMGN